MKNPKIALAKIKYFKDAPNNLERIKKFIDLAKKKNADIVCFPESCIHKNKTLTLNHELIKEIRNQCKINSIWCIITEDIKIKGKKYNMSLLIDRNGKIRGKYKKIHLYGDNVSRGSKTVVKKTDFGKIGFAICWDINFPELFKEMKQKGAEIIFCPSYWFYYEGFHQKNNIKNEMKILESLVQARSYENKNYVAFCSPAKDSKYHVSYSAIASPIKIMKKKTNKEGLLIQELNLKKIKNWEKILSY